MATQNLGKLLIAVDIDGTLLNTEFDDVLAQREIDALQAVRDAGHLLVLSTGRNLKSVAELLESSQWFPDDLPLVLLNGATVWGGRPRRCLANNVIDQKEIRELVRLFRQHDVVPMVYGTDDSGGILHHETRQANDILASYLDKRRNAVGAINSVDDVLEISLTEALEVGSIDVKDKVLELSRAILHQLGDKVKVINTRSLLGGGLYYWAEVFHTSCGKGNGLKVIREHYPEVTGPMVAIGDNFNDLDMFAAADFSVAMGNGPAEVLQQADFVTGPVTEGGAAKVLTQLAKGELALPNKEVQP
jgi:5-amino-6-(5-phospho-D-ribitylamino)uracil phosphatase